MTQVITLISVVGMSYLVAKFVVDVFRGKYRC